ncbi:winged helix-turn-helix domain-containing protein [Agilicoccus flavus]|uniref:winged helix-turn-helix domain-containing protein n=1 Tax=Agilicoccus flavus TaxID=2775968 RepID=UPI001CF6C81E|nr:crosslink repair DNA glycosylase YcaQ family protein [Agilicoccus flavus]
MTGSGTIDGGETERIPAAHARRIALAAQGFGAGFRPRAAVTRAHLRRVVDRLGVVQIDSVNVLARSHYLPFYSRLGPYDPALLDGLRDGGRGVRRHVVEYWAHEASLVPATTWPLFGFRMRRAHEQAWSGMRAVARDHPDLVARVLAQVAERGPITARDLEDALAHDEPRPTGGWGWNWSLVKSALEHLFWAGQVTSAGRTAGFARRYVVPEALLPPEIVARGPGGPAAPEEGDAVAELMAIAARAHGVGTVRDLRDYFRLSPEQAAGAMPRLLEEGVVRRVEVTGRRGPHYLHVDAARPRRVRARALLSPFDSLVWRRERTSEVFGFDYRLEIYTPAARRVHGYYVLPFLLDEALVGRVDAKADRAEGVLRVHAVHWEPATLRRRPDAPEQLVDELDQLATFLGLGRVEADAALARARVDLPPAGAPAPVDRLPDGAGGVPL